ncbi:hypothetical protein VDGL01_06815 [Verticillium dahliae]
MYAGPPSTFLTAEAGWEDHGMGFEYRNCSSHFIAAAAAVFRTLSEQAHRSGSSGHALTMNNDWLTERPSLHILPIPVVFVPRPHVESVPDPRLQAHSIASHRIASALLQLIGEWRSSWRALGVGQGNFHFPKLAPKNPWVTRLAEPWALTRHRYHHTHTLAAPPPQWVISTPLPYLPTGMPRPSNPALCSVIHTPWPQFLTFCSFFVAATAAAAAP